MDPVESYLSFVALIGKSRVSSFSLTHGVEELLCQIWSLEFKRCGRLQRWVKLYEQVGQ